MIYPELPSFVTRPSPSRESSCAGRTRLWRPRRRPRTARRRGDFMGVTGKVMRNSARWCPLVINWFINPINYGYITYKP